MRGLDGLKTLGGKLDIWDNVGMTSLQGLEGLTIIAGSLMITSSNGNDVLTSLQALDGLKTVGYDVELVGSRKLTKLATAAVHCGGGSICQHHACDRLCGIAPGVRLGFHDVECRRSRRSVVHLLAG